MVDIVLMAIIGSPLLPGKFISSLRHRSQQRPGLANKAAACRYRTIMLLVCALVLTGVLVKGGACASGADALHAAVKNHMQLEAPLCAVDRHEKSRAMAPLNLGTALSR